jgi:hypothetical protein
MQPRRKQPSITIRSAEAFDRLRELTRTGRSQAEVIEEALRRMPDPPRAEASLEERRARLEKLIGWISSRRSIPSMAEFDRTEYDENGNPR